MSYLKPTCNSRKRRDETLKKKNTPKRNISSRRIRIEIDTAMNMPPSSKSESQVDCKFLEGDIEETSAYSLHKSAIANSVFIATQAERLRRLKMSEFHNLESPEKQPSDSIDENLSLFLESLIIIKESIEVENTEREVENTEKEPQKLEVIEQNVDITDQENIRNDNSVTSFSVQSELSKTDNNIPNTDQSISSNVEKCTGIQFRCRKRIVLHSI